MWRSVLEVVAACLLVAALPVYLVLSNSSDQPPPWPVTEHKSYERTAAGEPICPKCGRSDAALKYLYGLRREAAPAGTVNGGCCVGPDSPEFRCGHCGATFGVTGQGK